MFAGPSMGDFGFRIAHVMLLFSWAVVMAVLAVVVLALVVLLVRFLLVGTKAAKLYVRLNDPASAESAAREKREPAGHVPPPPPAEAPVDAPAPPTPPAPRAPKRAPRKPPTPPAAADGPTDPS
jgi:hypothetical protein